MAEWIPVEERLPDGNFELLLLNLNGDCLWGWFGEGVFWDHRGKERLVTHWLDPHPLPGEEERDG